MLVIGDLYIPSRSPGLPAKVKSQGRGAGMDSKANIEMTPVPKAARPGKDLPDTMHRQLDRS